MMVKEYKKENVFNAASAGFAALYTIFRNNVKNEWKRMTVAERCAAARGLVALKHVSEKPDKYLSRGATMASWNARAAEYAASHDIDVRSAYYIVQSPTCIVTNSARGAIRRGEDFSELYNFAENVMHYDYELTSPTSLLSDNYAKKVVNTSRLLNARARAIKAKPIARPFMEIWAGMRNYEK